MVLGLKNSEPRCFVCYAALRRGPKASGPTGHCCRHLRACRFPAGIADCLAQKSSREQAARAKRMFSGPCSRPHDAIAKRSRITVPFLVTDPHTEFQRPATNSARGGRPRIPTHFDFNIIMFTTCNKIHAYKYFRRKIKNVHKSHVNSLNVPEECLSLATWCTKPLAFKIDRAQGVVFQNIQET